MIELPTTLIQQDAITDAAQRRGMSVTDWALDCLLTYASNHLGRGLGAWLELEEAYVQRGDYRFGTRAAPRCTAARRTPTSHPRRTQVTPTRRATATSAPTGTRWCTSAASGW